MWSAAGTSPASSAASAARRRRRERARWSAQGRLYAAGDGCAATGTRAGTTNPSENPSRWHTGGARDCGRIGAGEVVLVAAGQCVVAWWSGAARGGRRPASGDGVAAAEHRIGVEGAGATPRVFAGLSS